MKMIPSKDTSKSGNSVDTKKRTHDGAKKEEKVEEIGEEMEEEVEEEDEEEEADGMVIDESDDYTAADDGVDGGSGGGVENGSGVDGVDDEGETEDGEVEEEQGEEVTGEMVVQGEEGLYQVERILAKRLKNGNVEYLIKWDGEFHKYICF